MTKISPHIAHHHKCFVLFLFCFFPTKSSIRFFYHDCHRTKHKSKRDFRAPAFFFFSHTVLGGAHFPPPGAQDASPLASPTLNGLASTASLKRAKDSVGTHRQPLSVLKMVMPALHSISQQTARFQENLSLHPMAPCNTSGICTFWSPSSIGCGHGSQDIYIANSLL